MNTLNRKLVGNVRRATVAVATATVMLCTCLGIAAASDRESAERWQSLESIRAAARTHIETGAAGIGGQTRVEPAQLDERLRLPACPGPLNAQTPWSSARSNRVTVRVSCEGATQWRVHVPVDIVTIGNVVTSVRALARGTVLSAADLALTERELGPLGHGFFSDPQNAIGQRLKRALAPGSVVTPAALETPAVIQRGQNVTIVANTTGIAVKMNGTALQDGAPGQIIDVENRSSGKRLQGIVRSARSVEIVLH